MSKMKYLHVIYNPKIKTNAKKINQFKCNL